MRIARLSTAVAFALALVGCDIEEPNPAAPSDPASSASAGPAAGDPGAPATGGGGATTPSPGDPGGGTTTTPDAGTTPPAGGGTTPPPPAAAVTVVVNLSNMQYKDAKTGSTTTTIKVGDSVTWKNIDSMDHTTTSDTGLWDTPLAQGASWTRKFATTGSFPYSCMKHKSTMKGTIVVSP
jgi:plastocyanin